MINSKWIICERRIRLKRIWRTITRVPSFRASLDPNFHSRGPKEVCTDRTRQQRSPCSPVRTMVEGTKFSAKWNVWFAQKCHMLPWCCQPECPKDLLSMPVTVKNNERVSSSMSNLHFLKFFPFFSCDTYLWGSTEKIHPFPSFHSLLSKMSNAALKTSSFLNFL